ncbi:tetratricopeptide repeat protein [Fulvivirgaceae bacterium LMO-SS25]
MKTLFSLLTVMIVLVSCQSNDTAEIPDVIPQASEPDYEVMSLLGEPLNPPAAPAEVVKSREDALEDAIIWHGRRLGYMSRFNEAIEVFTTGLEDFPNSYKLLRHRGHRFVSVRKFDEAIADFEKAKSLMPAEIEVEPDGNPNALNIPLSNTQFNILYHLGLAYYLKGDYQNAVSAYIDCLEYCENDDSVIATKDWLYMTYRRMGADDKAAELLETITEDMNIIENDSYYNRMLMYKGLMQPEELLDIEASNDPDMGISLATQGYGVANWYLYNGDEAKAKEILNLVVNSPIWAAFGYIAAEVDLSKMQ